MQPSKNQDFTRCSICRQIISKKALQVHQFKCSIIRKRPERTRQKESPISISNKSQHSSRKKQKFQCYLCGQQIEVQILDAHMKDQCPNKQVKCEDCNHTFPQNLMRQHERVCEGRNSSEQSEEENQSSIEDSQFFSNSSEQESLDSSASEISSSNISSRRNRISERLEEFCHNRGSQSQLYRTILQQMHALNLAIQRRAEQDNNNSGRGMSKNQIKDIPQIKYKKNKGKDGTCSICCVDMAENEPLKDLDCKHVFHVDCLQQWLLRNKNCPNCKGEIKCPKKLRNQAQRQGRIVPNIESLFMRQNNERRRR